MFGSAMKVSEKITPEQRAKVRGPGSMPVLTEKSQLGAANQVTPKAPRVVGSMGGTTSAVTQRKQQQAS